MCGRYSLKSDPSKIAQEFNLPDSDTDMEAFPVLNLVNSPDNDSAVCVQPEPKNTQSITS